MTIGETTDLMQNMGAQMKDDVKVSLTSLSEMVGFPVEFIQKELLLEGDELSMQDLRRSMHTYLENKNEALMS